MQTLVNTILQLDTVHLIKSIFPAPKQQVAAESEWLTVVHLNKEFGPDQLDKLNNSPKTDDNYTFSHFQ